MKKRLFIQSVFPAPYRVGVFKELSKEYDIFVAFERNNDSNRNNDWFIKDFGFKGIILDNTEDLSKYKLELKKLNSYDAVIAYDYSSVSSIKLMTQCLMLGIPYFINCDGAFISRHLIKDSIKHFFISRAKACLASGKYAEKYFLTYGAKKENIYRHNFSSLYKEDILNETLAFKDKRRIKEKLGLPIDKKIVLSIGQFADRKGYDILLNSWKLVNKDFQLIIVGGGEKEQEYWKFIKENKMTNVVIEGYKSKDIIFEYYKAVDLFVLPTREDIWGLVINEAMACGLPIITTNKCVAGLELIEDDKNGYIIQVEDYEKLADKIEVILKNDEKREYMGSENLIKIRHYNIQSIAKSHINTLNMILGGN